jgi:hypothetical protein
MIRIKTLHIEDFRGIRKLNLDLGGKNFGICGPNGTGKSGVVDAIEFCLTGDITRLSGQGTAGLSVKNHAPHVDQRTHPGKANVTITGDIPSLAKPFTIHRSVKDPKKVEITPPDAAVEGIITELEMHTEFALSRREIVKYIITPPGQRSIDVQILLRLDHIERTRKTFTTFNNKCRSELDEAERNCIKAEVDLKTALKIDKLDRALVLEKINENRKILGLSILSELTKDTSFKTGIAAPQDEYKRPSLSKIVALADLSALQKTLQSAEPATLNDNRQEVKIALEKFWDDEQALIIARRHGFIKTGLDLVTEDACPLCDTPWKADDLRDYLRKKILNAEETEKLLIKLRTNINTVLEALTNRIQAIVRVIQYSESLKPPVQHIEVDTYINDLKEVDKALKDFLEDHFRVGPAITAITKSWWSPTTHQQAQINECIAAINALPDTSTAEQARDILSVAQDRYKRLLLVTREKRNCESQSTIAQKILDHYNTTATRVLEGIFDQVAKDFSSYYRSINHDDEEKFVGTLTSEPAKLSFNVDFYGRGLFPPGAYHSEGHQDAMGLCLYLALMKHTLGDKFTFAVLDDVLMSVDTGHRREVCRLLKKEFPNTQFILTTHDRVWLQYMKTENLIHGSQSFGGWTVDLGPRVWDDHDIWSEIHNELAKDNVPQAAWLLRRYLEYTAVILADNLRARIEFRGDGQYDLGDLMPNVLRQWRVLLEDGEKSVSKWKLEEEKTILAGMRAMMKELIAKTNTEQWAINPSVHFNEWANLRAHEFQEVVDAFRTLLEHLRCENPVCRSYLYISPRKGPPEELRCNCGKTAINLKT